MKKCVLLKDFYQYFLTKYFWIWWIIELADKSGLIQTLESTWKEPKVTKVEFMIFYNQKLNEKAFESVMYFDLLYISYLHIFRKRKKLGNSSVIRRSRKDYFFAEIYAPTTCINDLVSGSCLAQKITLDTHYNWIL